MAIIKKIKQWYNGSDNYYETIEDENKQLRKKLKRNNKDIIEIMNDRDELKDELLVVYRQRSTDFDQVLHFKEEYSKYYSIHKEQKKEIAELKSEIRKKNDELERAKDTIKKKDKKIDELMAIINSKKMQNGKRRKINENNKI